MAIQTVEEVGELRTLLDVGLGCGWVDRYTSRTWHGESDCDQPVAVELTSNANGGLFRACAEHALAVLAA